MENYFLGFLAFFVGSVLYLLGKMKEYKKTAKANPRTDVVFNQKQFFNDEWINITMLLIAGMALVFFLPSLIGGTMIDIKNTDGGIVTSFSLKKALMPLYFTLGYSGNSAVFMLIGKYKTTFLNQVGVSDSESVG